MQILAATDVPTPAVLAFSLFTNDDPRNVSALDAGVRASVDRAGRGGCAVWATIVRPPLDAVELRRGQPAARAAGERARPSPGG
jgi:hypothetical protein